MSNAGYTLTETLAAMAVLGMAAGGLTLGSSVLGSSQLATSGVVAEVQTVRAAQAKIERLLLLGAPFSSQAPDRFAGDTAAFSFECGGSAPCEVGVQSDPQGSKLRISDGRTAVSTLLLRQAGAARFVYGGTDASEIWPPLDPKRQALRSISLVRVTPEGSAAIFETRIWLEQPATCAFDAILQDCR